MPRLRWRCGVVRLLRNRGGHVLQIGGGCRVALALGSAWLSGCYSLYWLGSASETALFGATAGAALGTGILRTLLQVAPAIAFRDTHNL